MIGINATILGQRPSGLGVCAKNIIEELDRQGVDFVLYTSFTDNLNLSDKNNKRIHKIRVSIEPLDKVRHFLRGLWLQVIFPWCLKHDGISLVLNLMPEGPLLIKTPQVTVVHDLIPIVSKHSHFLQRLNFCVFIPCLLKRSTSIMTISQSSKDDLIRIFNISKEKIHVVHIAFDDRLFKPSDQPDIKRKFLLDNYFLYVGNILPHKNLALLIEAFSRAALDRSYKLVIAGYKDPRYYSSLCQLITKNLLKDKVVFLDYLPKSDLPLLMAQAQALVLPSFFEGFGLTPLEAMACGCPVAASDLASVREVCDDAVRYFNPYKPDELAAILKDLSVNGKSRSLLIEKGIQRAKVFSWEKCVKNLIALIKGVE